MPPASSELRYSMIKYCLVLLVCLVATSANAFVAVSVIPDNPLPTTPLQLRVTGVSCKPPPVLGAVEHIDSDVTVRFWFEDYCEPEDPLPEYLYEIGTLPTGAYTFHFYGCGNVPPGEDPCTLISTQPLLVAGGVAATAVPMLSPFALATIGMLFVGFGLVARRWQ